MMKNSPHMLNGDMQLKPLLDEKEEGVLEPLVELGLKSLLEQAYKLKVLEAPYGRPDFEQFSNPFPKEEDTNEEEEEKKDKVYDDEEDEESEEGEEMVFNPPEFQFEYGFNPCLYLGKFLHKYNPKNIAKVYEKRGDSLKYLRKRALHGQQQLNSFEAIQDELQLLRSGISIGPLCGSITSDSAVLWARASRPGTIYFEYDEEADFSGGDTVMVEVSEETDYAGKILINDLDANKKYFYRCCLCNEDIGFDGIDDGYFRTASFQTLPEYPNGETALKFVLSSLAGINDGATYPSSLDNTFNPLASITEDEGEAMTPGQQQQQEKKPFQPTKLFQKPVVASALKNVINSAEYSFMVLLGSPVPSDPPAKFLSSEFNFLPDFSAFPSSSSPSPSTTTLSNASSPLLSAYYSLYKSYYYNNDIIDTLGKIATLSAWNDSSEGALENLRAVEDVAAESSANSNDNKKKVGSSSPQKTNNKKLDTSQGNPLTPATQAFLNYFPIFDGAEFMSKESDDFSKEAQNNAKGFTYRKSLVCDGMLEFFFTDSRGGKIGTRQAEWLIESISESSATWKVVVTFPSIAYKYKDTNTLTALTIKNVNATPSLQRKSSSTSNASAGPATERSTKSNNNSKTKEAGKGAGGGTTSKNEGSIKGKGSINGDALETKSKRSGLSRKKSNSNFNDTSDRTCTMQSVILQLGANKVKNVLFLSGEMPQPFVATVGPLDPNGNAETISTAAPPSPTKEKKDKKDSKKDKKKAKEPALPVGTYFEFGACSFALEKSQQDNSTNNNENKKSIPQNDSNSIETETENLTVKEIIPIATNVKSSLYGLVTVSKSGKIKYNIYSSRDGTKKYSHEIRPQK